MFDQLAQLVFNGIVVGSIIAIGGIGLTLTFGTLKIMNFAHGDYLTLGAYATLFANLALHQNLLIAALMGGLATALFGVIMEFVLWRPFRARNAGIITMFIVSIGLSLMLRNAIAMIWGPEFRAFDIDVFSVYQIGPLRLSPSQIIVMIVAVVGVVAIALMLARTAFGKALRALADNRDLAAVSGIDVDRIVIYTWFLGSFLAGLAGVLQALIQSYFDPNFGAHLLLLIFAGMILGGIGSAYGCLIGSLILGFAMELSTWQGFAGGLETTYKPIVAFSILIMVLLVRPEGLLGRPSG
jgi:branched-subunit amino acid ABC-type transport system permease component